MEASTKPKTDWEAIEREYRAGQLSIREIGKAFGVSHTAIQKRARAQGWTQNLVEKVREAVATKLVSSEVASGNQRETIEKASDRVVQIVREHRVLIGRGQTIANKLFGELETDSELALPAKATTLSTLAGAIKTLIGLERQAFNLTDAAPTENAPIEAPSDSRRKAAFALLMARSDDSK